MNFTTQQLTYRQTGKFSSLILDYLEAAPDLRSFYAHTPDPEGIRAAIAERKKYPVDRSLLLDQLNQQYANAPVTKKLQANIDALFDTNTFTITTAHQPNIFTGHLYFIYKIIHAIRLADELTAQLSGYRFVPVYYIGSEDADLEELGTIHINGTAYTWDTDQKGAVGRMKIDRKFIALIDAFAGQLEVDPFGPDLIELIRDAYSPDKTIEQATFDFCNELFKDHGLVILMPDNAALKETFAPLAEKELAEQFSHKAVRETISRFPEKYKVQAAGRDINLFYLKDDIRERIEATGTGFHVTNTGIRFTAEELMQEIKTNPERISPNVILRPVYQAMILPDIIFIGGGGELAYWLELKDVFREAGVPYPVLILRNSFSIIRQKAMHLLAGLGLEPEELFLPEAELLNKIVQRDATVKLSFSAEKLALIKLYKTLRQDAMAADSTLEKHVWSLQSKAIQKIEQLEKKMLKSTRKRFDAQARQLNKLKTRLFPGEGLQERTDNFLPYYSLYGPDFLQAIYDASNTWEASFVIVKETSKKD